MAEEKMSKTTGDDTGTTTPAAEIKKKKGGSKYWLLADRDGDVTILGTDYDTPTQAWDEAAELKPEGKISVLCHRGTKTGGVKYSIA